MSTHASIATPTNAPIRRSLTAIARDRFAERGAYASTRGWLWSMYNRVLLRTHRAPLPWRRSYRSVWLPGDPRPFFLRLGTSDWNVLTEIFMESEYDDVLAEDLGPVRTIVDMGSNVGLSIRFWQRHFPGARIVAVEPDEGNMEACRRNALAPPAPTPTPQFFGCFVAGVTRRVDMDASEGEWAYRIRESAPGAGRYEALTLPEILARADIQGPIDLLKCDIEGAEDEVFANAAGWLPRVRFMAVELHGPYGVDRFREHLRAADPRPWVVRTTAEHSNVAVVIARRDDEPDVTIGITHGSQPYARRS